MGIKEKVFLYNVNVEGDKNGKREKFILQFKDTALKDNMQKIKHGYKNVEINHINRKVVKDELSR